MNVHIHAREGVNEMIFGKHINRYYLRYGGMLLLGLATLVAVDYLQLVIPNLYQMVVNGVNDGKVMFNGTETVFDMDFLSFNTGLNTFIVYSA